MSAVNRLAHRPGIRPAGRVAAAALATVLVASLTALTAPASSHATSSDQADDPAGDRAGRTDRAGAGDRDGVLRTPGQTSDGVPGIRVGPPINARGGRARIENDVSYQIAPGITVREWDQVDGRRPIGKIRANLLSVDLDAPDITLDYLSSRYVPARKSVSWLGAKFGAIGAVNGDFFDISDTGAPLGIGMSRGKRLRTGTRTGWIPENSSLWLDGEDEPHIGPLSVRYKVREHRDWTISGLNAATVPKGGMGLYNRDWGWTKGTAVTDGQRFAREVVVRGKRVRSNRFGLSSGRRIKGYVLIGRGRSATRELKKLKVGQKVRFFKNMAGGKPRMVLTGDRPLLVDGVQTVINDTLAHPRTAVGIDADGRRLLILVIDGRSSASRGYTMVELARMMVELGAEDALNLDGGGSSAMYSRRLTGEMGLINEPSDGTERLVPNGLGVVYHGTPGPVVPLPPTP